MCVFLLRKEQRKRLGSAEERIWAAAKSQGFTPNVASMISCAAKAKDLQTAEPLGLWSLLELANPSFGIDITKKTKRKHVKSLDRSLPFAS